MMLRKHSSRAGMVLLGLLAVLLAFVPSGRVQAGTHVAVSFFYDELEPYGDWVEHPRYGTVWYPRHRPGDWHPYVYGRWVWTADYGWYWDSDEEWGWATYHYGRWVYTDSYAWVWVPDDEWGPAWVEWRTGGGYVGWAPMPPEVAWHGGAFVYADIDMSAPRYNPCWVFVAEASFSKPNAGRYRAPRARTAAMLRASVRATNYQVVGARIVNRSIDVGRISAAANVRIEPATVVMYDTRVRVRADARGSGRVAVYRPTIGARAGLRVRRPPVSARVRSESRADDELPPPIDSHVRGTIGGDRSIEAGAGTSIGIGGGGVGIGGGGGLRIGR